MPTILTHTAVPLAIGLGLGSRIVSPRLLAVGLVWLPAAALSLTLWLRRRVFETARATAP